MVLAQLITRLIDCFYWRPFRQFVPLQLFRYAACGGLNMVLDAVWYFVIYNFLVAHRYFDLGVVVLSPHIASMLVVFPITFFNGFWLNRYVAFRRSPLSGKTQLFRYALSILARSGFNGGSAQDEDYHAFVRKADDGRHGGV